MNISRIFIGFAKSAHLQKYSDERFDPLCCDGNNVCQKDVGRMISPMIVVRPPNRFLKKTANCKSATKRLEQTEPTIACEPFVFEQKLEFSGSPWHRPQTYLLGTFVESTKFSIFVCQPSGFSVPEMCYVARDSGIVILRGQAEGGVA